MSFNKKRGFKVMLKRIISGILLILTISCVSVKKERENPFRITGEELSKSLTEKQFVPVTFIDDHIEFKINSWYLVEEVNATVKDMGVKFENDNGYMEEIFTLVLNQKATCDDFTLILHFIKKLEKYMHIVSRSREKKEKNCNTYFLIGKNEVPIYIWMKREADDFYIWYIVEEELLVKKK